MKCGVDRSAPLLPVRLSAAPVDHGDRDGVHEVVDLLPDAVHCVGGHEEVSLVQVLEGDGSLLLLALGPISKLWSNFI